MASAECLFNVYALRTDGRAGESLSCPSRCLRCLISQLAELKSCYVDIHLLCLFLKIFVLIYCIDSTDSSTVCGIIVPHTVLLILVARGGLETAMLETCERRETP